jgi:D-glycero-D-manno-heptose 1,7-bisphosphate phosphatase
MRRGGSDVTVWREPAATLEPGAVLFLDRDGVLVEERHYLADPAEVVLLPGAAAGLARARAAGYRLVGVSNQSGLGRGRFGPAAFAAVMERLEALLEDAGVRLDAFYYCPHGPDEGCRCRKPQPGLLLEAARRVPWVAATSWVIGDKASDVALAREAGLGAVHVRTGHGEQEASRVAARWADDPRVLQAADLAEAVALVLASGGPAR